MYERGVQHTPTGIPPYSPVGLVYDGVEQRKRTEYSLGRLSDVTRNYFVQDSFAGGSVAVQFLDKLMNQALGVSRSEQLHHARERDRGCVVSCKQGSKNLLRPNRAAERYRRGNVGFSKTQQPIIICSAPATPGCP